MALTKASQLPKAAPVPLDEYLQSRIDGAVSRGYNSTLAWVKNQLLDEAKALLKEQGYSYTVALEDGDKATQLDISW